MGLTSQEAHIAYQQDASVHHTDSSDHTAHIRARSAAINMADKAMAFIQDSRLAGERLDAQRDLDTIYHALIMAREQMIRDRVRHNRQLDIIYAAMSAEDYAEMEAAGVVE